MFKGEGVLVLGLVRVFEGYGISGLGYLRVRVFKGKVKPSFIRLILLNMVSPDFW